MNTIKHWIQWAWLAGIGLVNGVAQEKQPLEFARLHPAIVVSENTKHQTEDLLWLDVPGPGTVKKYEISGLCSTYVGEIFKKEHDFPVVVFIKKAVKVGPKKDIIGYRLVEMRRVNSMNEYKQLMHYYQKPQLTPKISIQEPEMPYPLPEHPVKTTKELPSE